MAAEDRVADAAVTGDAPEPMPSGERTQSAPQHLRLLKASLRQSATSFEFFQAVRLLERLLPDLEPVGRFGDPTKEVVRFSVTPSISFPPSEIQAFELPDDGEAASMTVNFFGLTGPLGVLPYQYTLLLAERLRARDSGPAAFFDMFHHRLISLFYRAWEKNRPMTGRKEDEQDRLAEHLLDLVGLGVGAEGLDSNLHGGLPFYAGLLGPEPRGAAALQQMIEDFFDVPAEVEQFVGGWYPLPQSDQCALGEDAGASGQLGLGAVAGGEVWDQQARVRVRLGPLTREQYDEFLPTGSAHAQLRSLVRYFSRDQFDFEAQLVLKGDDVTGCALGMDDAASQPLGWSTWIRTRAFSRDASETILSL